MDGLEGREKRLMRERERGNFLLKLSGSLRRLFCSHHYSRIPKILENSECAIVYYLTRATLQQAGNRGGLYVLHRNSGLQYRMPHAGPRRARVSIGQVRAQPTPV